MSAASPEPPSPGSSTLPPRAERPERPGQPLSIKLAAIIAVLVVIGLSVTGTITTVLLRVKLMAEIDSQLASTLATVAQRGQFGAAMAGPSDYVLMAFTADGTAVLSRVGLGHDTAKLPAIEGLTVDEVRAKDWQPFTTRSTEGGGRWRCLAAPAQAGPGGPGEPGEPDLPGGPDEFGLTAVQFVVLALPLDSVNATTRQMAFLVAWVALAVAIAATALGYAMVRRSLRPLRDVEHAAARIAAGDLTTRMPPVRPGSEVARLTDSLNAMLTQIEAAFSSVAASEARMRAFISDASHELRTPLAAIRGYAELYRMGALEEPEALANALRRIENESARMGAMVGDLSTLARLSETPSLRSAPVDLTVLAADAVADAVALDPDRPIRLLGNPEEIPLVIGDEAALRRVLTNLVANALAYTPAGSPIELALWASPPGEVVAEVRDHGPGIPKDKRESVFDRFFRLDGSRSRDSGGSGLGLAIVAGLVAALGGRVEVSETPGGGATFRVTLPSSARGPES
ncbi:MAG: HAMP domain-containing histidine kinase [Bifidobacteriaceae bacterium]|nr:HAMP domain-containing histidine kinase [Bifidobacteriaceae bacterium]